MGDRAVSRPACQGQGDALTPGLTRVSEVCTIAGVVDEGAQDLNLAIAAEVRAELARRGISVSAFERKVGWPRTYLQRRLQGDPAWKVIDLETIATELGVSADQFKQREVRAS